MDQHFRNFQDICISILAQSDNCQESQTQFRAAQTVPELVTAWQHFWAGVLHEVPEQVITAFSELYPQYRADITPAGVFYNEDPDQCELLPDDFPLPTAMVLVGDGTETLTLDGNYRVYVLGSTPLVCHGHCNVHVVSDRANVTLHDNCRCNCEAGNVTLRDRSVLNGKGNVTCYDSTYVLQSGGTLTDHGHLSILAYGDTSINSFTRKRITLNDQSTLTLRTDE